MRSIWNFKKPRDRLQTWFFRNMSTKAESVSWNSPYKKESGSESYFFLFHLGVHNRRPETHLYLCGSLEASPRYGTSQLFLKNKTSRQYARKCPFNAVQVTRRPSCSPRLCLWCSSPSAFCGRNAQSSRLGVFTRFLRKCREACRDTQTSIG